MADNTKAREDRVRRQLRKAGYRLAKTPHKSHLRELYGAGYMVIDASTNTAVQGATAWNYSADIDQVEDFTARLASVS